MKKIPSFTINHLKLLPGIYVSRKDFLDTYALTTFDIRITRPNYEEVMSTGVIHALEHLGATFLRNSSEKDNIIYFGPMGCRTGFYLIMKGDLESKDIIILLREMFEFMKDYSGEVPGATSRDCGNFSDMDLTGSKKYVNKFIKEVLYSISIDRLFYPEG